MCVQIDLQVVCNKIKYSNSPGKLTVNALCWDYQGYGSARGGWAPGSHLKFGLAMDSPVGVFPLPLAWTPEVATTSSPR